MSTRKEKGCIHKIIGAAESCGQRTRNGLHKTEGLMVINFDSNANKIKLGKIYKKFLEDVVRNDEIWILFDSGKVAVVETEEGACIPIWSSSAGAEANRVCDWAEFEVQKISPAEFAYMCIPEREEDEVDVIIEMRDESGIHKKLSDFENDLYDEAENQGIDLDEMCMDLEDFMEANDNFDEFIHEVLEERRIWILFDEDEDPVFADVEDEEALPIWTSEEEAYSMCEDEWEGCKPQAIPLREFIEDWAPLLERDDVNVMFSLDNFGGMGAPAKMLTERLRSALSDLPETPNNVVPFPPRTI